MAEVHSELYSVNKKDLWEILSFMMRKDQREFLISLFTELGECCHTEPPDIKNTSSVSTNYLPSTIDNLYTLTQSVIDEIVDVGITKGLINEAVKRQLSSLVVKKRKQSVNAARASNNWLEALRVYELQRASEQAKLAPLKDSKSHIDIDLSHIQDRVELTLRERCENLFKYIDTDGSGKISREELKAGLGHLGFNMSWEDIDDMMDGTDVDGDEEIDIDEVIDAICAALELNSNDAASLKSAPKSLDQ
jgi:energy-converting hydrogenase A subunit M